MWYVIPQSCIKCMCKKKRPCPRAIVCARNTAFVTKYGLWCSRAGTARAFPPEADSQVPPMAQIDVLPGQQEPGLPSSAPHRFDTSCGLQISLDHSYLSARPFTLASGSRRKEVGTESPAGAAVLSTARDDGSSSCVAPRAPASCRCQFGNLRRIFCPS